MGSLSPKGPGIVVVVVVVMMVMAMAMVGVVAESSLINQPDWGSWSYLGEDHTLHCQHSDLPLQPNNFIRWELPDGDFLDLSNEKYELRSDPQGQVVNMHLTVRNVQEKDSGVYVCHVYSTHSLQNKIGHMLRGLNLGVHLYREPFDQYEHGVLVGGCTAAVLLVLLSAVCLVYKFRYRTTPKQERQREASHVVSGNPQHVTTSRHERPPVDNGTGTELSTVVAYDGGQVVGEGELNGTELSTVVAYDGGQVVGEGELNRSYDTRGDEIATKM